MTAKKIFSTLRNLAVFGFVIFMAWDLGKIIFGGAPMLYQNFGNSFNDFIVSNPEKMQSASIKTYIALFVLCGWLVYFVRTKYPEPITPAPQVETLPEPAPVEKWQPWLHIPDRKDNRKIIQLWCEGKSGQEISEEVFLEVNYVRNIISDLRSQYPEAKIPKDTERRKKLGFD